MIDVTGVDLVELAKKAYELSSPQGLGFLHFTSEPLSDEEAEKLVKKDDPFGPLSMDYVKGRSIKLYVQKDVEKLLLGNSWYDHTDKQYRELLHHFGIEINPQGQHGSACNCGDCRTKRRNKSG